MRVTLSSCKDFLLAFSFGIKVFNNNNNNSHINYSKSFAVFTFFCTVDLLYSSTFMIVSSLNKILYLYAAAS